MRNIAQHARRAFWSVTQPITENLVFMFFFQVAVFLQLAHVLMSLKDSLIHIDAALDSYARQTGVDSTERSEPLSADKPRDCHSPEGIAQILLE
jgi:hypothetical protein